MKLVPPQPSQRRSGWSGRRTVNALPWECAPRLRSANHVVGGSLRCVPCHALLTRRRSIEMRRIVRASPASTHPISPVHASVRQQPGRPYVVQRQKAAVLGNADAQSVSCDRLRAATHHEIDGEIELVPQTLIVPTPGPALGNRRLLSAAMMAPSFSRVRRTTLRAPMPLNCSLQRRAGMASAEHCLRIETGSSDSWPSTQRVCARSLDSRDAVMAACFSIQSELRLPTCSAYQADPTCSAI